jgi:hypothetical protein
VKVAAPSSELLRHTAINFTGLNFRSSNSESTRFNNNRQLVERAEGRGTEVSSDTTAEGRITKDDVARHPVRTSSRTPKTFDCLATPKQLIRQAGTLLLLAPAAIPFLLVVVLFTDEAEIPADSRMKLNKRYCSV